jgi:hypothetical protein
MGSIRIKKALPLLKTQNLFLISTTLFVSFLFSNYKNFALKVLYLPITSATSARAFSMLLILNT